MHQEHAFEGIGLRPYAPVHLKGLRNGAGDLAVDWIRRSRIDADSWQSVEVPLGEESESYQIRVLTGEVIKREVTVTAPSWTYLASNQVADGVSAPYNIDIAQVSASFGPGLFRRLVVNI